MLPKLLIQKRNFTWFYVASDKITNLKEIIFKIDRKTHDDFKGG